MSIKAEQELRSLDQESLVKVMMHPAQRKTGADIAELIGGLRKIQSFSDLYEFQHYLFGLVYQVEERRSKCSRIIKRLQRGEKLPADACATALR